MSKIRRILMFIPGNSPAMINNASIIDADTIVFDLEDSVALEDKADARFLVKETLLHFEVPGKDIAVRINGISTDFWMEDLRAIVPCRPAFIQLPKTERGEDLLKVIDLIEKIEKKEGIPVGTVQVCPIIETALGIENAFQIAMTKTERLAALALGAEDLIADISGIRSNESLEIMYARQRLVNAARAAGISPSDTAFINVDDDEWLVKDCKLSRSLGFDGRAIISPRQVKLARSMYLPSKKEIDYAKAVIDAIHDAKRRGRGAITLNGKMVDEPIVKRARAVLQSIEESERMVQDE